MKAGYFHAQCSSGHSLYHTRAQRKAAKDKVLGTVPFLSPLPSAMCQLKSIENSSTLTLKISTGYNVLSSYRTVGFIPLRAVRFQSVLVAAAAAVHTSLLKKRNTNQHRLYNLFYIIITIIIILLHTCIYMYTYMCVYVYIYVCVCVCITMTAIKKQMSCQRMSFQPHKREVSVIMWNFTFGVWPCKRWTRVTAKCQQINGREL